MYLSAHTHKHFPLLWDPVREPGGSHDFGDGPVSPRHPARIPQRAAAAVCVRGVLPGWAGHGHAGEFYVTMMLHDLSEFIEIHEYWEVIFYKKSDFCKIRATKTRRPCFLLAVLFQNMDQRSDFCCCFLSVLSTCFHLG